MKTNKIHYAIYNVNGDMVPKCGSKARLISITEDRKSVNCARCLKKTSNGKYVISAFESF